MRLRENVARFVAGSVFLVWAGLTIAEYMEAVLHPPTGYHDNPGQILSFGIFPGLMVAAAIYMIIWSAWPPMERFLHRLIKSKLPPRQY
jgi:hypothetical protein